MNLREGRTAKLLWLKHHEIKTGDKVRKIVKVLRIRCGVVGKDKIRWYLRTEGGTDRRMLKERNLKTGESSGMELNLRWPMEWNQYSQKCAGWFPFQVTMHGKCDGSSIIIVSIIL